MIGYASNTGTRRNLDALRAHNWRILLTPSNPRPRDGLRYALDNGAWTAHQQNEPFDEMRFRSLLRKHGAEADFVVIPDIVGAGDISLNYSLTWLNRMQSVQHPLIAVQDGMKEGTIASLLEDHPTMGIFLGGTTEWKLTTMPMWGSIAHSMERLYHVGRVNSARRIALCEEAGATSFDGTSATRYSCTLPSLEAARTSRSLFNPRNDTA